ncbi:uncharacterized protein LOC131927061 isoform X2 [Physella acuta]|uniref:uncharacterized protein LOC131927061 isoform X2 n=1 Tax=Physella acuta TaxID=109671 RepID=UPI0027DCE11E|nr:uncharacterized protein LOC131927061 isoform X2 [Physella acuta]
MNSLLMLAECYILFVCYTLSQVTWACDIGWFGPKCEYKCHCTDGHCTTAGLCANNVDCARGWFGPLCQYQDLVSVENASHTSTSTWVKVTWQRQYIVQWISLQFHETYQPDVFTLHLSAGTGIFNCTQLKVYLIDYQKIDLVCGIQVPVVEVKVTWTQSKLLRTIHISGGRNVALKQTAQLTSTYDDYSLASHAVDGNTNTNYLGRSCVHTRDSDLNPSLTLILAGSYLVSRYKVYNRYDGCCPERLKGFYLTSYHGPDLVYAYTDVSRDALRQYTIVPDRGGNPVSRVNIAANYIIPGTRTKILSLCEVELYGDAICPAGRYSLDCSSTCICQNKSEPCHVATGLCPSVCPAGYWGQGCHYECPEGRWGIGCLQTCSESCEGGQCEKTSGVCTNGCVGYTSPNCSQACEPGWYGMNCSLPCDDNCADQCNHITGNCTLSLRSSDTTSSTSVSIGIGVGVSVSVVVLVLVGIGIVVYCKRTKTPNTHLLDHLYRFRPPLTRKNCSWKWGI